MSLCKICNNELETVISFGKMPISNRFVSDLTADEFLYDLSLGFCPECFMVQLEECVDPEMMFNEDYAYFSSISKAMEGHFEVALRIKPDLAAAHRNLAHILKKGESLGRVAE